MSSFALVFLFLTQLGLALALLWTWWKVKDRLAGVEARAAEMLDDQDLMEFQERVGALLSEVREAGKQAVSAIDERRAALEKESGRARDAEKRLTEKIRDFEKAEERARKKLEAFVAGLSKKARLGKAKKGPAMDEGEAIEAALGQPAPPVPDEAEKPSKISYVARRDFRPPEPEAPVSPTANRYLKVYEMADQGFNREEIAKACGYLPGEIELILNLRPRKKG